LRVVAAESIWGSLAAQLGGGHVEVVSLISSPDVDPHSYEPTAADARSVAMAQLLLTNGLGYDTWATKLAAADPGAGRHTVDVGTTLGLATGANPHRWYSPSDVRRIIDAITSTYLAADPSDRDSFEALRSALVTTGFAAYDAALGAIRTKYRGVAVGASESIFSPLADDLGLRVLTPPSFLRAISQGIDPTAADQLLINDQITQHQIKVYVENVQNRTPDIARQAELAQANGIPVVDVTETLVPANATFQQWQTIQLQQLAAALAKATGR
jgi:zinc/manganese transport system substrate-binding protein